MKTNSVWKISTFPNSMISLKATKRTLKKQTPNQMKSRSLKKIQSPKKIQSLKKSQSLKKIQSLKKTRNLKTTRKRGSEWLPLLSASRLFSIIGG